MELADEQQLDFPMPMGGDKPRYPYNLRICLTQTELEKLGLDTDCDVGDTIDMRCFATVTSISKDNGGCRIELQIEKMAVENEMTEETPDEDD